MSLFIYLITFFVSLSFQEEQSCQQDKPLLLLNASVHLGGGEQIKNAALAFRGEQITLLGDATRIRLDLSQFQVIRLQGKHIYAAAPTGHHHAVARDSLYAFSSGSRQLFVDLAAPVLNEGAAATFVVTEQALEEEASAELVMAFIKGREVDLQKIPYTRIK